MMNNEQTRGYRSEAQGNPSQTNRQAGSQNSAQPKKKKPVQSSRPKWLRVTLRILKALVIPAIFVIVIIAGLWVGYTKLGKQPSSEIFHLETWKHLFDLVFAEK